MPLDSNFNLIDKNDIKGKRDARGRRPSDGFSNGDSNAKDREREPNLFQISGKEKTRRR